ncbi:hypothetical protein DFA_10455 [Cavenderia fasciculata]|uniref:Serine-threonine kinase receptor-associated protein n=1 Tax=Cavenderia fasciculata TaxID=261658 RepID=F4QA94_CACFS|nr:uncharacterized protein DFA_10455 [Cavenderia fasciculata]EGG15613.1 hypothetical protein DFA_10455 [Cavenderia fasciculata]|eukprot:XP_004354355.1 hypothetical protein DFA_10455 [Cavenderia fasciculata]
MILDFHKARITDLKYNRQGDRLFVASHDDNVSQWDTSNGVLINKFIHPKRVNSISITQDSRYLVSAIPGALSLWNTISGELLETIDFGYGTYLKCVEFSHGDTHIVFSYRNVKIQSMIKVYSFNPDNQKKLTHLFTLPIIEYDLYGCVTWSPSNKYILANVGSRVDIFDVDTRELVHSIHVIGSILNGKISWTSDQSMFVIGSNCTTILYENNTWRLIRSFDIGRRISDATISSTTPPMIAFATGSTPDCGYPRRDKQGDLQFNIRLFNLDNTQQVAEIKGHDDPSYSISFSPDNKSIAIGGDDGYVIINQI